MTSTTPAAPVPPAPWPYGDGRPGVATAAAWLGHAAAAWTTLMAVAEGVALRTTEGGGRIVWLVLPAVLTAAGLSLGAQRLLARRGRALLLTSGVGSGVVMVGVTVALDPDLRHGGITGVLFWLLWVLPLPALTVVFAGLPRVGGWLSGLVPSGPLPYAPPPALWPAELWPHGPVRPGSATAAAVLAVSAGALTATLVPYSWLMSEADGGADPFTDLLLLGLPCAAGLVAGGILLLRRRSRLPLILSGVAAVLVLLVAGAVAVATIRLGPEGPVAFVAMALPLPSLAAFLAARGEVGAWLAPEPPR